MKKFSLSAAVVAALLVATSAFNKPDPVPTQGRIGGTAENPILVDVTETGFCTSDDKPCLYDANGNPIPGSEGLYNP